ncbi:MAG: hypothetical protein WBV46_09955 [Terriglobales bacterium]
MDFPRNAATVAGVPADFRRSSIGTRQALIEKIKQVIPSADFSDAAWGRIDGSDWSIEMNMGKEEGCSSFAFHVRGGEGAVGVVAAILERLDLRAVDSQTGDFFAPGPEALEGFAKWRRYRDQVMGGDADVEPTE